MADLVVAEELMKCVDQFAPEHMAQCINYLAASGLHVALILNFQSPKLEWRRVVREFTQSLALPPLPPETLPAA